MIEAFDFQADDCRQCNQPLRNTMFRFRIGFLLFCALAGGALLTNCRQTQKPAGTRDTARAAKAPSYATLKPEQKHRIAIYQGRGRVLRIDRDHQRATIAHQAIPGFMQAMIMTFKVRDGKLLDGIKAGDQVDFTLESTSEATVITEIRQEAP